MWVTASSLRNPLHAKTLWDICLNQNKKLIQQICFPWRNWAVELRGAQRAERRCRDNPSDTRRSAVRGRPRWTTCLNLLWAADRCSSLAQTVYLSVHSLNDGSVWRLTSEAFVSVWGKLWQPDAWEITTCVMSTELIMYITTARSLCHTWRDSFEYAELPHRGFHHGYTLRIFDPWVFFSKQRSWFQEV